MTEDLVSLLPMNATAAEQAIESTISRQLDLPTKTLWNPHTCPEDLLPWLAWSLSVDQWDAQWPVATQRTVIAESATIHRHKGTVGAVKPALQSLGVTVDFLEWFEPVDDLVLAPIQSTAPHTFVFIVWAHGQAYTSGAIVLGLHTYQLIQNLVEQTKPASAHFDFLVGAKIKGDIAVSSHSGGWLQSARLTHETKPVQVPSAQLTVGLHAHINRRRFSVARFYLI